MQGQRVNLLAVIVPDLGQVLVLFSSHLVHCLVVQRHNLVQDLGIVAGNVSTHHGRRLRSTPDQLRHLHMGFVTDAHGLSNRCRLSGTVRLHRTPLEVLLASDL